MRPSPLLLAVAALPFACAAPAPPPDEPLALPAGAVVDSYVYPGTGLTGAEPGPVELGDDLLRVTFRCYALERSPEHELEPVNRHSRFLADRQASAPLQVSSVLAVGSFAGKGAEAEELERRILAHEAGRYGLVHEATLLAPAGVTATCEARVSGHSMRAPTPWEPDPPVQFFDRAVALKVTRTTDAGALEVLIGFEGPRPIPSDDPLGEEGEPAAPAPVSINERMARRPPAPPLVLAKELLEAELTLDSGGDPLVLLTVAPFERSSQRTLAIFVEVHPLEGVPDEAQVATLRAELEAAGARASRRTPGFDARRTETALLWGQLLALESEREARRALVLLAARVGAPIAGDFALVATGEALDAWRTRLRRHAAELAEPTAESLAWALDGGLCAHLAEELGREELPLEVAAILARHLGEVGRSQGTLEELAAASATLEEFAVRVRRMNRLYLEDSDPAARARAFDWLTGRGDLPAGYDPLASAGARREALRAAEEAAAEAEAEAEGDAR